MNIILKVCYRIISVFYTSGLASFAGILAVFLNWKKLCQADLILIHSEGGFGYTITTPDLLRRHRKGEKIVIIFPYIPGTFNKDIKKIWHDVDLIFIQVAFRRPCSKQFHPYDPNSRTVALFPSSFKWRYLLFRSLGKGLRLVMPSKKVMSEMEYFGSLPKEKLPAGRPTSDTWVPTYFTLLRDISVGHVGLPEKDRSSIDRALSQAAGGRQKRCCLYLRLRSTLDYPEAYLRSGGEISSYLRAVKALNRKGYQVLLVGDRQLPADLAKQFEGMFVDAKSLNLPESLFYLFTATESDICIGECGGGFWLGPINGIPSMLINAYPFHIGWNNMVIYYKVLMGEDGYIVPAEKLFQKYGEDVVHSSDNVLENTPEELEAAISDFIYCVENEQCLGIPFKDLTGVEGHFWSSLSESYMSSIWMKLYGGKEGPIMPNERAAKAKLLLSKMRT